MPDILDPYRPRASLVHGADPRVKVVVAVASILVTAALPLGAWPSYVLLLAAILALAVAARLGVGFTLTRGLIAAPFALAALPLVFSTPGAPLGSLRLGPLALDASVPGLERFLSVLVKSYLSVQFAILLTATTRFTELLAAMRALRVPRLLVAVFGLMWRYMFLFVHEVNRLRIARDARSADIGPKSGGTLAWRARVTGGMVGNLFVRGYERSERVYQAMLARGYDGEVRTLPTGRLSASQYGILAGSMAILAFLAVLGILFG
ncbi:MAG: cobalt ECF transporter T component CbiQ [Chloroflexi bacterium]|nr:cobalt ECF transporter T component CbiQ [Chloroflexota bacterium]